MRVTVTAAILCCAVGFGFDQPGPDSPLFPWFLAALALDFVIGALTLVHIHFFPAPTAARRYISVVADMVTLGVATAALGRLAGLFFFIYLWLPLGAGMRFGIRHLVLTVALALVSIGCGLYFSDFWHNNWEIWLGQVIAVLLIPAYAAHLLHERNQERGRAEKAERTREELLQVFTRDVEPPLEALRFAAAQIHRNPGASLDPTLTRIVSSSMSDLEGVRRSVLAALGNPDLSDTSTQHLDPAAHIRSHVERYCTSRQRRFELHLDDSLPRSIEINKDLFGRVLVFMLERAIDATTMEGAVKVQASWDQDTHDGSLFAEIAISASPRSDALGTRHVPDDVASLVRDRLGGDIAIRPRHPFEERTVLRIPLFAQADNQHEAPAALVQKEDPHASQDGRVVPLSAPIRQHRRAVSPKRVLIVEDTRSNQVLLETIFRAAGHTCVIARNGDEALDRFMPGAFDLIMLDIRIGKLSGLEVLSVIRVMESGQDRTPCIILTAMSVNDALLNEWQFLHVREILSKPVKHAELLRAVARVFDPDTPTPVVGPPSPAPLADGSAESSDSRTLATTFHDMLHCVEDVRMAANNSDWRRVRMRIQSLRMLFEGLAGHEAEQQQLRALRALDDEELAENWGIVDSIVRGAWHGSTVPPPQSWNEISPTHR